MSQRFLVLDSFRGLCALSVVVFHLHVVGAFTEMDFFRGSALFVEFFFVLSGFVFAHGYAFKPHLSFRHFAIQRTFRLFPLHIFILIIFIVFEFGKLAAFEFGGITFTNAPFTGTGAASQILPNLFLFHGWSEFTNASSFNYPSWSISIEYYTYFIFFITIAFCKQYRFMVWSAMVVIMLWLIFKQANFPVNDVQRGLSCFFAGGLTYYAHRKLNTITVPYVYASIAETLLLVLVVYLVSADVEYKSIMSTLLFCLTVFLFSFEAGVFSTLLKKHLFRRLGELSYSIYMVHAVILFIVISLAIVAQKMTGLYFTDVINDVRFITTGNVYLNNLIVVVILAVVIFISTFTHKYIEKAGQRVGKKLSSKFSSENAEETVMVMTNDKQP